MVVKGKPIPEGLMFNHEFTGEERRRIDELRQVVTEKYPNLLIRTDDTFLARFIFNFDLTAEEAASKIYNLYLFRNDNPKYMPAEGLEKYRDFLSTNCKVMMDRRDREGRRIYVCKLADYIKANDVYAVSKIDDFWFEAVLNEPETYRNGVACILDVKNMSWQLMKWLQPSHSRAMANKNEYAPVKIHYHIVNSSKFMKATIPFVLQFMSSAAKDLVHFHYNDMTSLHKFIAPENLPPEYLGTGPPIDHEKQQKDLLFDNESMLLEALTYGIVPPEPKNWDNVIR